LSSVVAMHIRDVLPNKVANIIGELTLKEKHSLGEGGNHPRRLPTVRRIRHAFTWRGA
jgi:hypothetical protein